MEVFIKALSMHKARKMEKVKLPTSTAITSRELSKMEIAHMPSSIKRMEIHMMAI